MLVNAEKRDKLDAKSQKCFFIGYDTDEFCYKFWSEQDKKFIRSKNVIFNKRSLYKDKDFLTVQDSQLKRKNRSSWKVLQRMILPKELMKILNQSQRHLS